MITEHLATYRTLTSEKLECQYLGNGIIKAESQWWKLYFEEATNRKWYGVGVLQVSSNKSHTPLAIKLNFEAINNIVEYKANIIGLEATLELGI